MKPRDSEALERIEEIGEQVKRLSIDVLTQAPDVDRVAIKGMRDVLAPDYDDLEVELVRSAAAGDLPGLKAAVSRVLR
ncbi:MAG: HepT-like ribonuclease domain-containing protein [Chloroflexota bacterium]